MNNIERINLLNNYYAGDENSFNTLFEDIKKPVFYNIYSIVKDHQIAEDLLQETCVQLLKHGKKLSKSGDLLGYLMVTSKNISLNYIKRNKNMLHDSEYIEMYGQDNEDSQKHKEDDLLEVMKNNLDSQGFQIVVLHLVNELGFQEIANYLKIPIGTATWKYNESINKVKAVLNKEENENGWYWKKD